MPKLIEHARRLLNATEHVIPKKEYLWDPVARRTYRQDYRKYAARRAVSRLLMGTGSALALMFSQPSSDTVELQIITPQIATHQTETQRPAPSPMPEPSPVASSTVYERNIPEPVTVWTSGTKN